MMDSIMESLAYATTQDTSGNNLKSFFWAIPKNMEKNRIRRGYGNEGL